MEDGVEEYVLRGFDPTGEPQIRRTATGRLWLAIEFLPPSWAPEKHSEQPVWKGGPWADFDKRIAAAIGVPVFWEDKEWFRIDHPREDTIQAIHRFLVAEKRRVIAEEGCRDPVYAEVRRLYDTLRCWAEQQSPSWQTGIEMPLPPGFGNECELQLPAEDEIPPLKARLRQLSRGSYYEIFREEGYPKGDGSAPPARPSFPAAWRTEITIGLARHVDETGNFSSMPILADALEEAGCDNADILAHCREPGVHVRGCWVVDLVLGKE